VQLAQVIHIVILVRLGGICTKINVMQPALLGPMEIVIFLVNVSFFAPFYPTNIA